MKKLLSLIAVAAGISAFVTTSSAFDIRPLDVSEAAKYQATHVVTFDYEDLSSVTATNTLLVVTQAIPAKATVSAVGLVLDTAFDTANTNYTGSLAIKIGDGTDDDLFLTSTELASDGTEVWTKLPPLGTVNIGATGEVTTVTALGVKYYSSAGSLVYTLTPNEEEAVSSNSVGQARFFLRLLD